MRIVDAGHNTVAGMRGSWAGAMGQMQFMPSTLIKYGVDADGDGRINMMSSLPDIFSSAANYLTTHYVVASAIGLMQFDWALRGDQHNLKMA